MIDNQWNQQIAVAPVCSKDNHKMYVHLPDLRDNNITMKLFYPPEIIPQGISYLILISQFNRGFVLIMQLYDIQAIQITIQKYIGVLSSS